MTDAAKLAQMLIECGDELYSAFTGWAQTPGQDEALMAYAGYSNNYRKALANAAAPTDADVMRKALEEIKMLVCGDKVPNWLGDMSTFKTRAKIADICDLALTSKE